MLIRDVISICMICIISSTRPSHHFSTVYGFDVGFLKYTPGHVYFNNILLSLKYLRNMASFLVVSCTKRLMYSFATSNRLPLCFPK